SMTVGGSFTIAQGNGASTNSIVGSLSAASISGSLVVGGAFTLSHGNGPGVDSLSLAELIVGGRLSLTGRTGLYTHEIIAGVLHAGGGISVSHQASVDSSGGSGATVTVINGSDLVTPSITFTNGAGAFTNTLTSLSASISGSVTIRNGNTPADISTSNIIDGNFEIGNDLEFLNAAGAFINTLTSQTAIRIADDLSITGGPTNSLGTGVGLFGSLIYVGDDLTIRHGDGSGAKHTQITPYALFVGDDLAIHQGATAPGGPDTILITPIDDLTIGGDLIFRNGAGEFSHTLSASTITIRGGIDLLNSSHVPASNDYQEFTMNGARVTVQGPVILSNAAGGPTRTSISAGNFLQFASAITVLNGAGSDTFDMAAPSLTVKGNITLRNGAGETATRIAADAVGGLSLRALSITSLAGDDVLQITATGRIGSLLGSFGTGDTLGVDLVGPTGSGSSLTIAAPVILTAAAATTRAVTLQNTTLLGAFSLTGGSGADTVAVADSHLSGPLSLSLLGGDDTLTIDRTTVRGAFTLLAGAGNDVLNITTDLGDSVLTHFIGPVTVRMDAGDDTLTIGETSAPTLFASRVLLDGGQGSDTLTATLTLAPTLLQPHFLATLPTVLNFE
ncbi:MAG TPA: hypothetical protein VD994_03885, partial [Prosthecobacter sp.]|nr:hypothetical protein [Prosthecobacter sp.]